MIKLLFILLLAFLFSCEKSELNPSEYYQYLEEKENGLMKEQYIGGLHYKVKYLPPSFLAYKDIYTQELERNSIVFDSVLNYYKHSMSFLLTLEPDDRTGVTNDVMLANVMSKETFYQRVMDMNFNIENDILLIIKDENVPPSLVSLENIYGLKNGRNINVIFSDLKLNDKEEIIFEYNDKVFGTGISRFNFKIKDINSIPKLNYKIN